jgi:hypothetical protein
MFQKFCAVLLFLLMVVAVATTQRGLRYCLCLDELFVGGCECASLVDSSTCPNALSCDSGSCCSSESKEDGSEYSENLSTCFIDLYWDLGQYSGASSETPKTSSSIGSVGLSFFAEPFQLDPQSRQVSNGVRGPPDPPAVDYSVPIFIRHSVFLV